MEISCPFLSSSWSWKVLDCMKIGKEKEIRLLFPLTNFIYFFLMDMEEIRLPSFHATYLGPLTMCMEISMCANHEYGSNLIRII